MKNILTSGYQYLFALFLCVANIVQTYAVGREKTEPLKFKQITTDDGLSTNEVLKVFQDREGFLWFATRYGLCRYDGYQVSVYKSGMNAPGLLTDNNVYCFADSGDHLWIGSREGVNLFDKRSGEIRHYTTPVLPNNLISCMLATRDGEIWLGTDAGLCRYVAERDSFLLYDGEQTGGVLYRTAVKSLFEDAKGDLWIGTWSDGLFRYARSEDRFFAYPKINRRNSAHVIYQDSKQRMWVGGWNCGLCLVNNAEDPEKTSYTSFVHDAADAASLSDNIVYDIVEDLNTHTLWVGTRTGLSVMSLDNPGTFVNYNSLNTVNYIPCDEINSLLRDRVGNIWLGSIGGGVLMADTKHLPFSSYLLDLKEYGVPTTLVRSLFADADGDLWLGVGSYGLARKSFKNGTLEFFSCIPEFSNIPDIPTVNDMIQRRNGEIWFATYDGGIMVYKKGEKVRTLTTSDTPYLLSLCVMALCEDSRGNCWVGCRGGVGVGLGDGSYRRLDVLPFSDGTSSAWYFVKDILEDVDGSIWVATSNCGIIHVSGDIEQPETLAYDYYSYSNAKLTTNSILCLHLDKSGRLWVGTEGGGLYLYDRKNDSFENKNKELQIAGDMICSMEEDECGGLWIGTNAGLVHLSASERAGSFTTQVYTTVDGLQSNFFTPLSSCSRGGELFFGGNKGYNSFFPDRLEVDVKPMPYWITDIKIYNQSLATLDPAVRNRISPVMPPFAKKVELPYDYNNFSIEFASLTYKNPNLNHYAYRLVGFDKGWQYTDADRRFAYYNNLKSGTYKFCLKATNENGIWGKEVRELVVVVLPPYWATWWAYLIYFMAGGLAIYLVVRTAKNRMRLRNELHLREMANAKLEELNHIKLQFFTNITHELLMPLTIISATVDELKMQVPGHESLYTVMSNNIQRLIRLLQQILEFRKAETGNLKLRVSLGDVALFVRNGSESFQPLAKKRNIHLSVCCQPESIVGYFDTDKLDKILYNLLSNAAKYNKEGGHIQVTLSYADDRDFVRLSVKDDGSGIPKEKQKNLFQRFYEGDYRRFNTIGTGIGLSLTKDLVELHGGTITVQSEEGKGTEFVVTLPVARSYFQDGQVDEPQNAEGEGDPIDGKEAAEEAAGGERKAYSVLVIEDNTDLLQLMIRLLQREYNVRSAENGKEAITVLEQEDIDLIVTDVMMPVMDGIELCKLVKSKLEWSHIPVILLTAKNQEEDRAEAYEVGADAFISKPFSLAVLHARIRNLLKAKERKAGDFKKQLVFEMQEMEYTTIDEEFIRNAIECVNRHLEDSEFDQTRFVDEMGTSRSTLYKKLKTLTGLNPSAFIRNIRLKAACRLMEEKGGAVRISDVSYAVGFNDPKYFSSCFRKEFGILPTEYQERFAQTSFSEKEASKPEPDA